MAPATRPRVVAPGEVGPPAVVGALVAEGRGLLEGLVVVDAEDGGHVRVQDEAAGRGAEEAGACVAHRHVGQETLYVGGRDARADAVDLRFPPGDRKCDRRVEQDAEVVAGIGEFPEVVGVHHEEAVDGLLKAGVELVAGPRGGRHGAEGADAGARQQQVLVVRRFHGMGIRSAEHRAGPLDVVRDAGARLEPGGGCRAVVTVEADAAIHRPLAKGDVVLDSTRRPG